MNAHNTSIIRKGRISLKIYLSFWHTENSKIKQFSVKWQKQNIRDIYYYKKKKIQTFWDTWPRADSGGYIPLYLKDPWKKDNNKKIINFCRFSLMSLFSQSFHLIVVHFWLLWIYWFLVVCDKFCIHCSLYISSSEKTW